VLDEAQLLGFGDRPEAAADAQLAIDIIVVLFDGTEGQEKLLGDLYVREARDDQAQDLQSRSLRGSINT
jgi:hypothetical protein